MNIQNFIKENMKLIIMAIFATTVLFLMFSFPKQDKNTPVIVEQVIAKKVTDYQPTLNTIEAKSYYVYDILDQKTLFSKDEHNKLPLASITKLMSGLVILDIMPDQSTITITKDDIALEGDNGLVVDEKWNINDLLNFSLITSSNDGFHAIASALNYYQAINNKDIVKIMNDKANTLGLKDTVFINETGLDIDENMAGAYSSAYDVAMLFEKIIKDKPGLISSTKNISEDFVSQSNIKHTAVNTNTSINQISGLMASKTGFTSLAGGNLAVVFDAGFMHPVVIVVLGSTSLGRFEDVIKLEKITLQKLSE